MVVSLLIEDEHFNILYGHWWVLFCKKGDPIRGQDSVNSSYSCSIGTHYDIELISRMMLEIYIRYAGEVKNGAAASLTFFRNFKI
jgi:hypothetical protein